MPLTPPAPTPAPTTMRAVSVDGPGGPDVLKIVEAPRPRPGRGEVLVRRVVLDRVFPLAEAAAAHRLGETGRTTGKIVLSVAS
ncbi:NADPH:quinone reductase [Streptomyces mobaraensis NBRC 13819 = DSM 40847]|uniref:NADPH:quinone reductase n=1 Tax=Streptomyces mobaraensis (strain ATCC 29032 / DSM 40847 / JCM 4168 / NBRC 13819 / NCIMB 11159 / IPCR 16-22) TaxID=1223523 RepID=M3BLJ6_STRM1|nr:NADPH:quinone reductase [Streptomyces mobaraensis NBRC 13819 = DSM 40847]